MLLEIERVGERYHGKTDIMVVVENHGLMRLRIYPQTLVDVLRPKKRVVLWGVEHGCVNGLINQWIEISARQLGGKHGHEGR